MSAGKIILLVFGVIGLLISIGLVLGGAGILIADNVIKDNDGFYSTKTIHIDKNSYAVVTGPTDVDVDVGWNSGLVWDLGDLVTFRVEGSNRNSQDQLFIGIAEESDIENYLENVEYDEIRRLHTSRRDVDYRNHSGDIAPASPTTQTFWTVSTYGTGTQSLEWELEEGSHSLVIMNTDGSAGIDANMEFGAKIPLLLGIGVGILVTGIIGLSISILFIALAARRPVAVTPTSELPAETPALAEETTVVAEVVDEEKAAEPFMPVAPVETAKKTSTGLDQNVAGLLCYLFGWVTGIIFLILEKENKLVRFHAIQSIIIFGFFTVASGVLGWIPFIGDFFSAAIGIIAFVVWIVLMVKASQGAKYKVFIAGDIADKQSS
jgi:uncharacterized membrane protein